MDKPVISVVVPIYNVQDYLKQCVDSILAQSYPYLDIILVDDGSTDGSSDIVDSFVKLDSRVIAIHKDNGGLLSARAAGAAAATGKYITFVDSDDWIESNTYETLLCKIVECDADWITSGCYRYHNQSKIIESFDRNIPEGFYDKNRMIEEIYPIMMYDERLEIYALDPSACFKLYKRDLLLPILNRLKIHNFYYGEDSAISYLYALKANSMVCTNNKFYYHRQRINNVVPPYFVADDFFKHLLEFYDFMISETRDNLYYEIIKRQIDLFVVNAAGYKKMKYGIPAHRNNYFLFPFDEIRNGRRIIIYGAGVVGKCYKEQIKKFEMWDLVKWVDMNYKDMEGISSPESIFETDFDFIVIALVDDNTVHDVNDWLVSKGVAQEKIIHNILRCNLQ